MAYDSASVTTHKMYNIPMENIEARLEYLIDGDCAAYRFTQQEMKMAEKIITNDIQNMKKYLFDPEKNIPMPDVYFKTNKSSRCKYCNYQALCFDDFSEKSREYMNQLSYSVNC